MKPVNKGTLRFFQYNKFIKGIDREDQYFSYYSVLGKTVKRSNVSLKLSTHQSIFVYKILNTKK
jgi:hypothetical protein